MTYHNLEEGVIGFTGLLLGVKAFALYRRRRGVPEAAENNGRIFFTGTGFVILGVSSAMHALIHALDLDENLLFQTLFGYALGLLILILSISVHSPEKKKFLPLFYLPLLVLFFPGIYRAFPDFGVLRPLIWSIITYLSGALCILHGALFQNTGMRVYLYTALSFFLIAVSSVFLFFPSAIGSVPWIHGHLMRPLGFVILLFALKEEALVRLKGSILYRALTVFTLLAGLPLIFFSIATLYQEIDPVGVAGRRFLVFILVLTTLLVSFIFGIGMVSRLIRPILKLKKGVDQLPQRGFVQRLEIHSHDEIEELAHSFNQMVSALDKSLEEQVRLTRLAAAGELAATLAHEIRNPLNAIGGAATYIGKNFRGSLISEFLNIIKEETSRMNKLTTSLLNFSKPVSLQPHLSDMNALINETIGLVSAEYADKGVALLSSLDGRIPQITVDPNQIKQVLINLLVNALEATPPGKSVTVHTETVNGNVKVTVSDSGKGIKEDDVKNIFNPFFTTKTTGTGLGLAISERIVKEHGGEITVESEEGRGSAFSVLLPAGKR